MTKAIITVITQWIDKNTMNNKVHNPIETTYNIKASFIELQQALGEVFEYWQDREGKKAPSPSTKDVFMVKLEGKIRFFLCRSYYFEEITNEQFLEWKARTLFSKVMDKYPEFSEFWDAHKDEY